jgi:hypothetical protein
MIANNVPPPHAAPTNAEASQQDNETLEANEEAMLLRRLDILAIYTKANDHEAFNRVVDDIIKQFGREMFSRLWLHMLRDEARREVARILATAPRLPEPSQVCKSCPNIILKAQYWLTCVKKRYWQGPRRLGTKLMGRSRGEEKEEEVHKSHVEGFIRQQANLG